MSHKQVHMSTLLQATQAGNGLSANKDPRGLIRADLEVLRRTFKPITISPKSTQAEIMFSAGEQKVIDFIEQQLAPRY